MRRKIKMQDYTFKFIIAIVIFIIFYIIATFTKMYIEKLKNIRNKHVKNLSKTLLADFVSRMVFFVIIIIGTFITLHYLGFNISTILVIIGSAGLAIALAVKDFLAQLVGGLIIISMGYYKMGDIIEVEDRLGMVTEFDLLNTTIRNNSEVYTIIPNNNIINGQLKNYSKKEFVFVSADTCISNSIKGVNYKELIEELKQYLKKNSKYCINGETRARVSKFDEQGTHITSKIKVKSSNFYKGRGELYILVRTFFSERNILLCDYNCVNFLDVPGSNANTFGISGANGNKEEKKDNDEEINEEEENDEAIEIGEEEYSRGELLLS